MTAKVGETVLIIHSQANRDTRPHLIGGHENTYGRPASLQMPYLDQETWFIPGYGGAAIYTFAQPGSTPTSIIT